MQSLSYYLNHSEETKMALWRKFFGWLPDRPYLKGLYLIRMGKRLNLKNPRTFSEKLQWLKLYNRRPEYTTMVDKLAAKEYVASIIGEEYIIPTLGVWDRAEGIDWNSLPEKFVLKCTHDSGGVVIVQDKSAINRRSVCRMLKRSLRRNYYCTKREWPYKNVPRRIIAEQYIDPAPDTAGLPDYKFFCFGGTPCYCQVITGRGHKMCIDFFDRNWQHQPFHEPKYYPFADNEPPCPSNIETMWHLAEVLSQDIPFVRIDFYNVNGKIYFGEITFYPTSGMGGFNPDEWDTIFGNLVNL